MDLCVLRNMQLLHIEVAGHDRELANVAAKMRGGEEDFEEPVGSRRDFKGASFQSSHAIVEDEILNDKVDQLGRKDGMVGCVERHRILGLCLGSISTPIPHARPEQRTSTHDFLPLVNGVVWWE